MLWLFVLLVTLLPDIEATSHESPDSRLCSVFLTFQVETVLDLRDSWKTRIITVYPGLRTDRATQPFFEGYPLKIKLTRDCFHGHLRTPFYKYMEQNAPCHCDIFCWTWAVPSRPILGSELY